MLNAQATAIGSPLATYAATSASLGDPNRTTVRPTPRTRRPARSGLPARPVAAGVDIVGISSLVTFLENTSPYRRAYREREYGSLAADREFLHEVSPLTRIDQLRAPLFIIHRANDPRGALSEAEQIHAALTARGQECELLVDGNEGHGLVQRSNREDALPKAIAFLPGTWPPDRSLPVARYHHDRAVRVPHNLAADRTHHPTRVWSSWSLSPLQ
jgi:fermentation-respiration switch protein FrsA (DUF1100 family)